MARDVLLRSIRIVMGGARLTNRGATFLVAGGLADGGGIFRAEARGGDDGYSSFFVPGGRSGKHDSCDAARR